MKGDQRTSRNSQRQVLSMWKLCPGFACLGSTINGVCEHVNMQFWFRFFRCLLDDFMGSRFFFYFENYTNFLVMESSPAA